MFGLRSQHMSSCHSVYEALNDCYRQLYIVFKKVLNRLKANELLEPTEELCVVSEEIRTLDVRQSIDQLLRSLRLKCETLNKLTFKALFEI